MNSQSKHDFDKDFNTACELFDKKHTHQELLNLLENGNIVEKHFSALNIETITSQKDGRVLVSNLTGQDGKVREAVSFRIKEFLSDTKTKILLESNENYKVFLDAITDINGNICRNIISGISYLKDNEQFCQFFCPKLVSMTLELIPKVKQFGQENGYKVNKEAFKLYWCLETIYTLADKIDIKDLEEILTKSKDINEYPIREKCAKILTQNIHTPKTDKIKNELKQDNNYYVRRFT